MWHVRLPFGNTNSFHISLYFLNPGEYIRCVSAGACGELHGVPAGHGHPGESGQAPG